jgi:hydroxymethylbilane synthase
VPTRIAKLLAEDSWDALVLAKAGLERLGYRLIDGRMEFETHHLFVTDLVELLPAPGQGAIGLEIRSNDAEVHQFLGQINDGPTWFCTSVEREFLRLLDGGCSLPVGIRTTLSGSYLTCEAIVFDETDKPRFGSLAGEYESPAAAASELLTRIYEKGN